MTVGGSCTNVIVNVLRLLTFGGLGLESDDGSAAPRLRPTRLALLAVLASAGERGISRERVASFFWSDSDDEHARHSLRQALYALRHELGCDIVRSGAALSLDPVMITSDVADFRASLAAGNRERATGLVRAPFLDGFYLPAAREFERWVEEERARLHGEVTAALAALTMSAAASGDRDAAVDWWRQLTATDPLNGRFALGYLRALAARGDRAKALAFARQYEGIVRRELQADLDPDIRLLEAELRGIPAIAVATPLSTGSPAPPSSAPVAPLASHARANTPVSVPTTGSWQRHRRVLAGTAALLTLAAMAFAWQRDWLGSRARETGSMLAVGVLREEGLPDSLRIGGVLTDMLATNLARVEGLSVLANSRLLELMRPAQGMSAAGYSDAARRAGATDLLEGSVFTGANAGLVLEMRRVDLRTGVVKGGYRVAAADRYSLIDSVTQAIARQLGLPAPGSSVAEVTTRSPTAYRLYEEGLRAYHQADPPAALRLMAAALEEDSTFAMAAYYAALLSPMPEVTAARLRALRLALRAPDRERLTIAADLRWRDQDPYSLTVAESLTTRYPKDPRALATLGNIRSGFGDWPGTVAALERAIVLDSTAEPLGGQTCNLCSDFMQLADLYLLWDSLPAADRTARRYLKARPESFQPFFLMSAVASRIGKDAAARENFRRLTALGSEPPDPVYELRLDLVLEAYDAVERGVQPLLTSLRPDDFGNGRWLLLIALRNQGRLREATQFFNTGRLAGLSMPKAYSGSDQINEAVLAFDRGDAAVAAAAFARRGRVDARTWAPGLRARHLAWSATLQGMALAAVGDTLGVLRMADTVEYWGQRSSYGRDRRAHHYLRGLVLASAGRHEAAVREYQAAIYSTTLGFTRVNYEMARCLIELHRPREAAEILGPALRGEIDASNLYVTRTDLHELLAQAFDAAGLRDSAAVHYRAVVKAWQRADPSFAARRDAVSRWLAQYAQSQRPARATQHVAIAPTKGN